MAALITRRAARGSRDKDDDAPDVGNAALRAADNEIRSHSLFMYIYSRCSARYSLLHSCRKGSLSVIDTDFSVAPLSRRSFLDFVLLKITPSQLRRQLRQDRVRAEGQERARSRAGNKVES